MAIDFIKEVGLLKAHTQPFILNPKYWEEFHSPVNLTWEKIEFIDAKAPEVPAEPGIYAFVVSNRDINIPSNGYIMYIGIVGYKKGSPRTLRQRYREYINEERKMKRPHIHFMLNQWKGHVDFHFTKVSPDDCSLEEIEKKLCKAIIPPCNENDFDAEIKQIVKAAW